LRKGDENGSGDVEKEMREGQDKLALWFGPVAVPHAEEKSFPDSEEFEMCEWTP